MKKEFTYVYWLQVVHFVLSFAIGFVKGDQPKQFPNLQIKVSDGVYSKLLTVIIDNRRMVLSGFISAWGIVY